MVQPKHQDRTRSGQDASLAALRKAVQPLTGGPRDYDALLDRIGNRKLVLIGEASHGTHEFYRERAKITQRLITERGFTAVALEADWPDAFRVNRFVRGGTDDPTAEAALRGFSRFPTWMWRNEVVEQHVTWLREHNRKLPREKRTGIYGLDLYSLHNSIEAVLSYLDRVDPAAAARMRSHYGCFDEYEGNSQAYASAVALGARESCEPEVRQALEAVERSARELRTRSPGDEEELFSAHQNARLIKNAEEYYRTMFRGRVSSWNLRDQHMAETLIAVANHLESLGREAKIVVWAHNSHLGDARATEMGAHAELNLGQLVRERWGDEALAIGFSTYEGSVTAASGWDAPAEHKRVRPGLPKSYERLFHELEVPAFYLDLERHGAEVEAHGSALLQRAIGVIYLPETERQSHYFNARLVKQFDVMLHFDRTGAVQPLDQVISWDPRELPDTYPFAE